MAMFTARLVVAYVVLCGWAWGAVGSSSPPLPKAISAAIAARLDRLAGDGDFAAALADLNTIFDQVIAWAMPKDLDVFREAAFAVRLVSQLSQAPPGARMELLKYLRASDNLARTLVFLVRPGDRPADVYALLDRLRRERGAILDRYASLTAAICVVHDRPFERRVNENRVSAPDAVAIFDYYTANEARMNYGIRQVPAELLVYVVDTTASIEEMNWALARYAGNQAVGRLFFEVKYDYDHLRTGKPKKVTAAGYNLPNILLHGGVCADQAYFAASVGKAIGVPTAVASGAALEGGHSWVGYLQGAGRTAWWNFDSGRYEAYRGVRGVVIDPQSRQAIPDSFVSLLAELVGTTPAGRQNATAMVDAARRMMERMKSGGSAAPPAPPEHAPGTAMSSPREASVAAALDMLELAVRQSPGDRWCWLPVQELARDRRLTLAQKRQWAEAVIRLCGGRYPDFLLTLLGPMIETVDDVREQDRMWNAMFAMFGNRPDLAAAVRMAQGAMWERAGQINSAGLCYYDVIERYSNAGPFVIDALQKAEKALVDSNRAEKVIPLYETTWQRIRPPREMAGPFVAQSVWYRVGKMLAERLEAAGRTQLAQSVRARLAGRIAGGGADD